jgi:glycogen debranching enzyme
MGGSAMTRSAVAVRTLAPPPVVIEPATDITGVLTLKHGNLYLLTDAFGDVHPGGRGLGLYRDDTRVLSRYELRVNGFRPLVLRASGGPGFRSSIQLTNPDVRRHPLEKRDPEIVMRRQSMGIVRERLLADAFRERISVRNYTSHPERCEVTLTLGTDGADIFEVRGMQRVRRGDVLPILVGEDDEGARATFAYRGLDGVVRTTFMAASRAAVVEEGPLLRFSELLEPGGALSLVVSMWTAEEPWEAVRDAAPEDRFPARPVISPERPDEDHRAWAAASATVRASDAFFERTLERARSDLRALVATWPGTGEEYVAAGVPWFATLFGRDAIISALETLAFRPRIAIDTLEVLARHQSTVDDPSRDAEPGKILHELRTGEMARLGEVPHVPYFGSVDSTPLWLVLLSETHAWTGDDALVERLWPNALAALDWIDRSGDLDGDGFVEYRRRSDDGLLNQGWKDSFDGIRMRDGRLAEAPIALVEVQGYVWDAKRRLAALAGRRGDHALAERLFAEAEELRGRFEAAFWMEEAGTYAMALDRSKRQADAIASNAGHALWSGIVAPERAGRVAAVLLSPAMDPGWGIRTLAGDQAGFNPIGYHLGSVWPHDNALIAAGLKRYGLAREAGLVAEQVIGASRHFRDYRLPELYCGFSRDESPLPVPYPVACVPQAWAAGAPFSLLQTMLGLRADAPAGTLELVAPELPEWLERVVLQNVTVGKAVVDLHVSRTTEGVGLEVVRRTGSLDVVVRA